MADSATYNDRIIAYLKQCHGETASVSEICNSTGIPIPTLHRQLHQLKRSKAVWQNSKSKPQTWRLSHEQANHSSSPQAPGISEKVLQFLGHQREPIPAIAVAKGLGHRTKKEVNSVLYRLERERKVVQSKGGQGCKPLWCLSGRGTAMMADLFRDSSNDRTAPGAWNPEKSGRDAGLHAERQQHRLLHRSHSKPYSTDTYSHRTRTPSGSGQTASSGPHPVPQGQGQGHDLGGSTGVTSNAVVHGNSGTASITVSKSSPQNEDMVTSLPAHTDSAAGDHEGCARLDNEDDYDDDEYEDSEQEAPNMESRYQDMMGQLDFSDMNYVEDYMEDAEEEGWGEESIRYSYEVVLLRLSVEPQQTASASQLAQALDKTEEDITLALDACRDRVRHTGHHWTLTEEGAVWAREKLKDYPVLIQEWSMSGQQDSAGSSGQSLTSSFVPVGHPGTSGQSVFPSAVPVGDPQTSSNGQTVFPSVLPCGLPAISGQSTSPSSLPSDHTATSSQTVLAQSLPSGQTRSNTHTVFPSSFHGRPPSPRQLVLMDPVFGRGVCANPAGPGSSPGAPGSLGRGKGLGHGTAAPVAAGTGESPDWGSGAVSRNSGSPLKSLPGRGKSLVSAQTVNHASPGHDSGFVSKETDLRHASLPLLSSHPSPSSAISMPAHTIGPQSTEWNDSEEDGLRQIQRLPWQPLMSRPSAGQASSAAMQVSLPPGVTQQTQAAQVAPFAALPAPQPLSSINASLQKFAEEGLTVKPMSRLASSPAEGGHSAVSGASSLSPHQVNSPVDMIEQQMVKTGLASHHSGSFHNEGVYSYGSMSLPSSHSQPTHSAASAFMSLPEASGSSSGPLLKITSESFAALNKNPISALMEYAQSRRMQALIEVVSQRGPSHRPVFVMAAKVGNRQFAGVTCSNKKDGRKEAADVALRTLIAEGQYSAAAPTPSVNIAPEDMTHFDKIAALTHQTFNTLIATIPENLAGRKVIAGMVMKCGEDDVGTVISIGTGNRCITGDKLSLEGNTVNDSHAEIVTRRGFMRFLYQQLETYQAGQPHALFESGSSGKLRVKPGITFHLYISTAPCGDGALFSPRDVQSNSGVLKDAEKRDHHPTFSSNVQGLLRTKMEGGEGTIPVDTREVTMQTWDGVVRGERLRTMSCTDKICRWNVLGLQGALLSLFLEPIYLDSLTLGFLYDHGHLSRAVCCRLDREEPPLDSVLPSGYHLNHPWLGRVTACQPLRETQKTKAYSINWTVGDDKAEVLDGTLGHCYTGVEKQLFSRLAKRSLYDSFKRVAQHLGRSDLLQGATYHQTKMAAQQFQAAKAGMVSKFQQLGCGWVKKPVEEEMFS